MSKAARLSLLALATVIAVGGALVLSIRNAPETELERRTLFPELAAKANEVSVIEITAQGTETVLKRAGETWVVANRDDFPAVFEAVKQLVLATAGLRVLEEKTSTPELYPRLGVEAVDAPEAKSRRIVLKDASGAVLVDYLAGKNRESRDGGLSALRGLYVRLSDSPKALLVDGELNAAAAPVEWMRRDLFDITIDRVRAIEYQAGESPFSLARERKSDSDYILTPIPQGQRLRSQTVVNGLAAALTELRFDDVASAANIKLPADAPVTRFRCFDGLVVEIRGATLDGKTWHAFKFSVDDSVSNATDATAPATPPPPAELPGLAEATPPAPAINPTEEAERLNALTAKWVYRLPGFKASMLNKRLEDLTSADAAPSPAGTPAPESETGPAPAAEPTFPGM